MESLPLAVHLMKFDPENDVFTITEDFVKDPKGTIDGIIAESNVN